MADPVDRLLDEALRLSHDDRAWIVTELLASLEPDVLSQGHSEADWIREIERRARAAVAGSPALSWSEARARIQTRLSSR
jgi:hypothetical protein